MTARPLTSRQRAARNHEMRDLRKLGWTYARIAEHYGLSRQRVYAIVKDGKP